MTLIERIQARLAEIASRRNEIADELESIANDPEARGLTTDEAIDARLVELRAEAAQLIADQTSNEERLTGLQAAAEVRAEVRAVAEQFPQHTSPARVTREERTYSQGSDPIGARFLMDVARRAAYDDIDARDRLARHMREERVERGAEFEARAVATSAFAGLVVPQYLTDMVAPAAAAARPFADICMKHPLPPAGTTVNISRITTATSAAAQTENNAASETNIDDTLLTETMFTVAGQQTLSRQAIDRGVGTEDVTLNDLVRRYNTALDSKLINDSTTGLTNVAGSVAYTDASPTAAELYPKILSAQAALEAVMLDQGVGDLYAVMHSRRWAWMQSQVGSTWPFIAQPGYPVQSGGANFATGYAQGVRGVLPNGIKVIVDNNIATNLGAGTNEDEIYVVNAAELHLWEDPNAPLFIRAEQTLAASLGVLLVVYGYAAYSFRRYTNGHQKIAGTGLVTPTF